MVANSKCFTQRIVSLPNPELVLAHVNNGQAGKEVAEAVLAGRVDDVAAMITRDKRLLTTSVGYDATKTTERPEGQYGDLLTLAVSRCDLAMEARLLDLGMPVDGVDIGGALTLALLSDNPEMAELLLQRGASPDPQKRGGENAMNEISSFGHVGGVMMLLRHGLDLKWEDQFGFDHLHGALAMQQFRIAELLIEKGASPWRIGTGGAIAAQYFARPLLRENAAEDQARLRLLAIAERDAAAKGFSWPLPDIKTVRAKVLSGAWPTGQMLAAGVPPVSPAVMAHMRERFSQEIAP